MVERQKTNIGLLTDIHYDGGAEAMNRLYEAVVLLNAAGVDAMLLMGDLVNGDSELHAQRLLREVAAICDAFKGCSYFMHGNHDLDYISKAQFFSTLGRAGDPSRFDFKLGGYSFICIDGNFSPDHSEYNCGNFQWQESFVPEEQLEWLRGRLAASLLPVVVISHQRIDKECIHAVRNHEDVRSTIALSDKVSAVFQGHNHEDDLQMIDGTSYYTLAAHVDGAGPAVIQLDAKGVRLMRDIQSLEMA
ncbi:MAG: metallophosphoesterase [Kiritimatiellaceae bacterium]|nr:metallophosphoesterase [Kiritimatiellaceae bacterium]